MAAARSLHPLWSLLTLSGTRALLTALRYRILVGLIAVAYALSAMVFAGMLYFPPTPLASGTFFYIYPSGPGPAWMYPAIWAGSPNFQLDLPFFSAILMTLSAAGVGLGMGLAVLLSVRLIRRRKAGLVRPVAVGSAAGFTPAMIALVTLGACCSTTAAATAGITLAAQSSGTNAAVLLANTWYLGVFQVVVIYVALIAQEQLVRVYGFFSEGSPPEPAVSSPRSRTPTLHGWRGAASGGLRITLVVAGLTWSLSMFAGWISTPPGQAGPWTWFGWIFQHQVPGVLGVLAGLFPAEMRDWWTRVSARAWGRAFRGVLVISGGALVAWMPIAVTGVGTAALGNELLGFWRFPAGWGAVAPPAFGLTGLLLRWAFQFALLGSFAMLVGISPEIALRSVLGQSSTGSTAPSDRITPHPVPSGSRVPAQPEAMRDGVRGATTSEADEKTRRAPSVARI
jgi:hypothetical protein